MKKKVIIFGIFALIISLNAYLFAFDIPVEEMMEDKNLWDGWVVPTGNFLGPTDFGEIEIFSM